MSIDVGDKAPNFSLPTDSGGKLALKDLKGRKTVLYFYPKDDTPGCTTEALGFTEAIGKFSRAGAVVVGVSKDSPTKHDKFKDKHGLKVVLVSDENGSLCEDFGVWVEKNMYGRKFLGIERSTFLIDEKGVVRHVWRRVKVKGHVDAVLEAVKDL